jgi:hypothetical protein
MLILVSFPRLCPLPSFLFESGITLVSKKAAEVHRRGTVARNIDLPWQDAISLFPPSGPPSSLPDLPWLASGKCSSESSSLVFSSSRFAEPRPRTIIYPVVLSTLDFLACRTLDQAT